MYTKIVEKPLEGKLMSAYFYSFNDDEKRICFDLFPHITEDSIVIFISDEQGINILGYYTLDSKRIVESIFIDVLIQNTERIEGESNPNGFLNKPCIHISQWIFDESLKDKDKLKSIFTILMASLPIEEDSFIWLEGKEPIYYPLKKDDVNFGHNRAISYFAEKFLAM